MAELFTVEMSPPVHNGMTLDFRSSDQHFRQNFATHIHPFLERLVSALRVLRDGFVDEKIRLFIGAPECEICLQAEANSQVARLRLDIWPDFKRSTMKPPKTVFSIEGSRQEIIEPFVTALKKLRAEVGNADFERGYGSAFPDAEYERLTSNR
ncbi:hypothetical protein [Terricaulis silvestris]|uniref:Uncharacterized protein n=1 Tax=Terricaulis silvestris TaxID=2686094 RepID=A0A6I6MFQ4_9CAUL|nr:hypothetical protein [Terricaulis silvestris]QGZ93335.1 hypothetical protein DSM104635_00145 [Terricaulis silvestris]